MGGTNSTEKDATEAQLTVEKAQIHSMSPTSALLHKKQGSSSGKDLLLGGNKTSNSNNNQIPSLGGGSSTRSQDLKTALANANGLDNHNSNNNINNKTLDAKAMKENIQSFVACLRGPPKIPVSLNIDPCLAGLHNYGNTCYANSVMQMLFHTPAFRYHILERHAQQITDLSNIISNEGDKFDDQAIANAKKMLAEWKETTLWYELAMLFSKIAIASEKAKKEASSGSSDESKQQQFVSCPIGNNTNGLTYPYRFPVLEPEDMVKRIRKTFFQFDNREQHDAHEFALAMLNTLFDEEKKFMSKNPKTGEMMVLSNSSSSSESKTIKYVNAGGLGGTLLDMTGQTVTLTSCIECDTTTSVNEKLIDVSCVLEPKSSLRHVAEIFTNHEILTGENKFRCDCCGSSCVARRRTVVSSPAPSMLLLQIKRFRYTSHGMTKLNDFVPFSDRLRVPIYDSDNNVIGSQLYRLCAFVVHMGSYPMAGHYFCIAYHRTTKQWMILNDTKASVISERERAKYLGTCSDLFNSDQGNNVTAYVLSYEKDEEFDERQQQEEVERRNYQSTNKRRSSRNFAAAASSSKQGNSNNASSGRKGNRYDDVIV